MSERDNALFAAIRAEPPRLAVILGSGLSAATADFTAQITVPYAEIPGFAVPSVPGHRGHLAYGNWSGVPTLVCSGRVHFYEGHPWPRVTRLVDLAAEWGVQTLLLTNAAGGMAAHLQPGDLMLIREHVKLLDRNAWKSLENSAVRFEYSRELRPILHELDPTLPEGVYAALTGPCYETPAEIRALRSFADAVGMSTAMEAEAAARHGMQVAAISTITNKAAGLGDGPLSHAEVEATARLAVDRLGRLIGGFVARLGATASLQPGRIPPPLQ